MSFDKQTQGLLEEHMEKNVKDIKEICYLTKRLKKLNNLDFAGNLQRLLIEEMTRILEINKNLKELSQSKSSTTGEKN